VSTPYAGFTEDANIVVRELTRFLEQSRSRAYPAIHQKPLGDIVDALNLEDLISQGGLAGETLEHFLKTYLINTTRLHHPGYLAHQVTAPHPTGALGSLIDGFSNNPGTIYEMGPAATAIEIFMTNWMLKKIGWTPAPYDSAQSAAQEHGGGVLTHGGSLANLTALLAARSHMVPDFWKKGNPGNLVLLVPEQSHYSLKRSAAILGYGEDNCLALPADKEGRVDAERLPEIHDQLSAEGKKVVTLVANACGTAAGLYDPLEEIARFCRDKGIWLHVDAAHGGGALLCEELRPLTRGIHLADSVIWDAHKMLRTPAVCAAVLVRDHRTLDRAFMQDASYLIHEKDQPGYDLLHRHVECTKAALGLRFFMAFAAMGEKAMADYILDRVRLAQDAARLIAEDAALELAVMPETNIVCFRLPGDDELQLTLRKRLLERGDYYISSTMYKGKRWLRLVFMTPETTLEDVRNMLETIKALRAELP